MFKKLSSHFAKKIFLSVFFLIFIGFVASDTEAKTYRLEKNKITQSVSESVVSTKSESKRFLKCNLRNNNLNVSVVYFICYVACRAAGHSVSFCINSCSLIADRPSTDFNPFDSENGKSRGDEKVMNDITQERMEEIKISVFLIEASMFGHKQTINEMLDFGANIDVRVSDIYKKDEGVISDEAVFTRLDADDTPLMAAIKYGAEMKVIELLLRRGASPNVQNKKGITPLKAAVENKRSDVAELLKTFGAK